MRDAQDGEQRRLPDIGLQQKHDERRRKHGKRHQFAGKPRFSLSARNAAARMAKAGFRNSDGCKLEVAEIEPTMRAVDVGARRTARQRADTAPARTRRRRRSRICLGIEQRGADEDRHGRHRKGELFQRVGEISRAGGAARGRRAGGDREHQTDGDQREDAGQRHAVDRPPPAGESAIVGARKTHAQRLLCCASRAISVFTAARNASPRASKSRN